ncbi:MAG: CD3324 family protein [Defluviitaleaceae bacterium]|nr:CD3324 family protein [Defluviitaleaceae bacterium]
MNRSNASILLPEELLLEVQRYVQGKLLYIPKMKCNYKKWGDGTQSKVVTLKRNNEIRLAFATGSTVEELVVKYHLSHDSIKKIVYAKK